MRVIVFEIILPTCFSSGSICLMSAHLKYLKFGGYLLEKNLIGEMDILKARFIQKKNNLKIGELARSRGWLTEDDIQQILVIQEDTYEKFGEIASRENFLMREQIETLLKEQEDNFFGGGPGQYGSYLRTTAHGRAEGIQQAETSDQQLLEKIPSLLFGPPVYSDYPPRQLLIRNFFPAGGGNKIDQFRRRRKVLYRLPQIFIGTGVRAENF